MMARYVAATTIAATATLVPPGAEPRCTVGRVRDRFNAWVASLILTIYIEGQQDSAARSTTSHDKANTKDTKNTKEILGRVHAVLPKKFFVIFVFVCPYDPFFVT